MGPFDGVQTSPVPVPQQTQQSGANPYLAAAGATVQAANDAVAQAANQLRSVPMYSNGGQPNPTMPVPGIRGRMFQNASPNNLAAKQPVTAAGQRSKGIGMLAGAAAGVVGKFMQKKEQEKTQLLAQDVHRTMELYQGIEEAQQILKDNPNDLSAKATLQKNTALLNSVLNGKNAKEIAKVFDITFGKESTGTSHDDKQKSTHYQAGQMAMKQMQQDRAQQFQDQMPQRLMVNPAYQRAYQQYQDAVKAANEAQKSMATPVAAAIRADGQVAQQQMKDLNANARELGREEAAMEMQKMKDDTSIQGRRITAAATVEAAKVKANATIKAIKDSKVEIAKITMGTRMYGELGNQIKNSNDQITKLQTELNKPSNRKDKKQSADLQAQIADQRKAIAEYKQLQQQFAVYAEDDPDASAMTGLINGLDEQ